MADLTAALRDLVSELESGGFEYAIGGALALAVWAVPRATMDIDVTLWCDPEWYGATLALLLEAGADGDLDAALQQARDQGVAYLRWGEVRLDVFLPSIPFYAYAHAERVRLTLPGIGDVWFLSAETLAVFKLLFFRPKDVMDVEKLVAVRGPDLDRAWVRHHLVACVGEDDVRVSRWDELVLDGR